MVQENEVLFVDVRLSSVAERGRATVMVCGVRRSRRWDVCGAGPVCALASPRSVCNSPSSSTSPTHLDDRRRPPPTIPAILQCGPRVS
eukprot:3392743-Pyramimonas_sp.AAC.2